MSKIDRQTDGGPPARVRCRLAQRPDVLDHQRLLVLAAREARRLLRHTSHDDSLGVKDTFSSLLPLMHREFDLQREDGGVHTMSMSVGNDAEGSIFESSLIHRGKGAPLPERPLGNSRSASGSKQLPGFDMPENGSSMSTAVRIQSAALHYYGGKNAIRIPLSDKKAQLAHHA